MGTKPSLPSSARLSESFKNLSESAARLNAVSDEFARATAPIDAALKKLNLGVSASVKYVGAQDQNGDFWERRIGYGKVSGKWGLTLSTCSGNSNYDDYDEEAWLFNDAPRWMRIEAIDHLSELVEELVKEATKTAANLENKIDSARELANTITALGGASRR